MYGKHIKIAVWGRKVLCRDMKGWQREVCNTVSLFLLRVAFSAQACVSHFSLFFMVQLWADIKSFAHFFTYIWVLLVCTCKFWSFWCFVFFASFPHDCSQVRRACNVLILSASKFLLLSKKKRPLIQAFCVRWCKWWYSWYLNLLLFWCTSC